MIRTALYYAFLTQKLNLITILKISFQHSISVYMIFLTGQVKKKRTTPQHYPHYSTKLVPTRINSEAEILISAKQANCLPAPSLWSPFQLIVSPSLSATWPLMPVSLPSCSSSYHPSLRLPCSLPILLLLVPTCPKLLPNQFQFPYSPGNIPSCLPKHALLSDTSPLTASGLMPEKFSAGDIQARQLLLPRCRGPGQDERYRSPLPCTPAAQTAPLTFSIGMFSVGRNIQNLGASTSEFLVTLNEFFTWAVESTQRSDFKSLLQNRRSPQLMGFKYGDNNSSFFFFLLFPALFPILFLEIGN